MCIRDREEGGTIWIQSKLTSDAVIITIIDDGCGFDTAETKADGHTHIGITNVRQRLESQCPSLIHISADRVVPVEDLEMCKVWFEDTGIEFEWQAIPSEGAQEKINLMLASGEELPDVFWSFGDGKSGNIVVQYADQDIFMPTEGLINEYMPNLKKILDDSENYWSEITAPDGHTYGFPYIEEMYGLVLTGGPLPVSYTHLFSRFTLLCSKAASDISMSSLASWALKQPTVTISQSRMVAHEKFSPTKGVQRPAAMDFIVMTGFFAS